MTHGTIGRSTVRASACNCTRSVAPLVTFTDGWTSHREPPARSLQSPRPILTPVYDALRRRSPPVLDAVRVDHGAEATREITLIRGGELLTSSFRRALGGG